jgi:hypothetical protein
MLDRYINELSGTGAIYKKGNSQQAKQANREKQLDFKASVSFCSTRKQTTHDGHNDSEDPVSCSPLMDALRTLRHYYLMTENQGSN